MPTKVKKTKKPARKAKPQTKQNVANNPVQGEPVWSQRPDWERNPAPIPPTPNVGEQHMDDEDNG